LDFLLCFTRAAPRFHPTICDIFIQSV
jgi:hypothetical protein